MNYLMRGQIITDVRTESDLTIGTIWHTKEEMRVKTYNFKKYAIVLDDEDSRDLINIKDNDSYYDFVNKVKTKYR